MVDERKRTRRRQTGLLLLVALGMFGFSFALVPLYEVFCEITGLNGRTASGPVSPDPNVTLSDREVTVQFTAHVSRGMPWEFRPTESQLRVRLGQTYMTQYVARNRASQPVTGQAVPSVAPGLAARHLIKVECFCFTQQVLTGGEELSMPVQFYVDAELPEEVNTISLSYTMFRADDAEPVAGGDGADVRPARSRVPDITDNEGAEGHSTEGHGGLSHGTGSHGTDQHSGHAPAEDGAEHSD